MSKRPQCENLFDISLTKKNKHYLIKSLLLDNKPQPEIFPQTVVQVVEKVLKENGMQKKEQEQICQNVKQLHDKFGFCLWEFQNRLALFQTLFPGSALKDVMLNTKLETISIVFKQLTETILHDPLYREELFDPLGSSWNPHSLIYQATESLTVNPWVVIGAETANKFLFNLIATKISNLPALEHEALLDDFVNVVVLGLEHPFEDIFDAAKVKSIGISGCYTYCPSDEELKKYFQHLVPSNERHPPCIQCKCDLDKYFDIHCDGCMQAMAHYPQTHWMRQNHRFSQNRKKFLATSLCAQCSAHPCTMSTIELKETSVGNMEKIALPWCSLECWANQSQDFDFRWRFAT